MGKAIDHRYEVLSGFSFSYSLYRPTYLKMGVTEVRMTMGYNIIPNWVQGLVHLDFKDILWKVGTFHKTSIL